MAPESQSNKGQNSDILSHEELLKYLAKSIIARKETSHQPLKHLFVAIDGFPGSGKSTLARDLAAYLEQQGQANINIELDHFAFPRSIRWISDYIPGQQFFNLYAHLEVFDECVVTPLKLDEPKPYCPAVRHFGKDIDVERLWLQAPAGAIILVNGLVLMREEMREIWDFVIYLDAEYETYVRRLITRDRLEKEFWDNKVQPAKEFYTMTCKPREHADIVLQTDDFEKVKLVKGETNHCLITSTARYTS